MRKKIEDQQLEIEILRILNDSEKFLSIRGITQELEKKGLKRSPQVVRRHVLSLFKQSKIIKKHGKEKTG